MRESLIKINITLFIIFFIIGLISYNYNGVCLADVVNDFSTFFGGSSFVAFFILFFSSKKTHNVKLQNKYERIFSKYRLFKWIDKKFDNPPIYFEEYTIVFITFIGTLWFIIDWEIIYQPSLRSDHLIQWNEVISGIIGWLSFMVTNYLLYVRLKNKRI